MGKLIGALIQGAGGSPCCCAPPPAGVLSFQTCGGTATLCGMPEFTSPSSPPKKYRTKTQSGGAIGCLYALSTLCTGVVNVGGESGDETWSGTYTFDRVTCAETNALLYSGHAPSSGPHFCGDAVDSFSFFAAAFNSSPMLNNPVNSLNSLLPTPTVSATTQLWNWDGICHIEGSKSRQADGNCLWQLTDEDTEDDAIARDACTYAPCTPSGLPDCSAYKTLRGAGVFALTYRSAQVKVTSTGNVPGQLYEIIINLQRRVQGSGGAFVDWATITDEYVGPASDPYVSPWYQIPCDSGYEVAANSVVINPV